MEALWLTKALAACTWHLVYDSVTETLAESMALFSFLQNQLHVKLQCGLAGANKCKSYLRLRCLNIVLGPLSVDPRIPL